jgi:hypothetical protein
MYILLKILEMKSLLFICFIDGFNFFLTARSLGQLSYKICYSKAACDPENVPQAAL